MAETNKSQNLTALLSCGLDLISRYMWLATIYKKIQLKRSNETQNTNEIRLVNLNLLIWTKLKVYSTKIMFKLVN